jgi:ribosomal-protein-alanine N-acetyltransferase
VDEGRTVARTLKDVSIELLPEGDIVASAQCIAIDADAFPYESARFGKRPASAIVWVARLAGERRVSGFLAARTRGDRLEIDGVAVRRDVRRRGIGRELVRAALVAARASRARVVVLHVSVTNDGAIALYLSEGFHVRRRLRDFYPASAFGAERDAFEMIVT